MKKIALLTVHLGANFGSILQTIASVDFFSKMHYIGVVVNYIPDRCTWKYLMIDGFKSPLKFIRMLVRIPILCINKYIYNTFLSKYVNISQPIFSRDKTSAADLRGGGKSF